MFNFMYNVLLSSWDMLQQASIYILFGLLMGGLLKMFLSPAYMAAHLGTGRFSSVFKAALLGIPIPLCSCGVLPAAASLKKQAIPDLSCPVDNCCDGTDCSLEDHKKHQSMFEKLRIGVRYAATDLWTDLAGWFFVGILLA